MFKDKKLIIFLAIALALCLGLGVFIRLNYCLPILMYHMVNPGADTRAKLVVSQSVFERQMRFLKEHHYNVITMEEIAEIIKQKKKFPARAIAITLDDGYKDVYTYAFPILKKYSLPAAIFIIVEEIGRKNDKLAWEEIKQMQDSGLISVGSHTLSPEPLVNLNSDEEVKRQIFESKRILEEKLGRPVNTFSYPEGRFNQLIRQLVIDAGYKVAVATNPGKEFPNDDIFALKRLRISGNASNLFIFWGEASGFYNYIREHRRKKR